MGGNTEGLRDWVTAAEEEEEKWGTSLYLAQRCAALWGEGVGVGLDGRKALPLEPRRGPNKICWFRRERRLTKNYGVEND